MCVPFSVLGSWSRTKVQTLEKGTTDVATNKQLQQELDDANARIEELETYIAQGQDLLSDDDDDDDDEG